MAAAVMGMALLPSGLPASAATSPTTPATSAPILTASPTGHPTPTPGTPTTASTTHGPTPATPGVEPTLSPAELAAQIARAQQLTSDLSRSSAGIAAATTKLDRLSVEANTLLQQVSAARDVERSARAQAAKDLALYRSLSARLTRDRQALGAWAYQAYAGTGGTLTDVSTLLQVLSEPAAEATDVSAQLGYLSDQRAYSLERVRDHTTIQHEVAAHAVAAQARATAAAAQAAAAQASLVAVIVQEKAQLVATRQLQAAQVDKIGPLNGTLLRSGDQRALDAARALSKAALVPGVTPDGSVKACSTDESDYPNGQLPASALCPLLSAPAQSLRPAAAAAFNQMSLAYQRDTGSPLCVTDSYRSLAEQVLVKATRGDFAAAPGTSKHGLGLAVDLCGGVEDFGNPAHLWMNQHAPLYGWYHPAWAEPTGSLPEPWHWEFAG